MYTKNMLMLVILSAGMLTGLTATMIQAAPVYADTKDCKDNSDKNCNENEQETGKISQENDCKIVNEDSAKHGDSGDGSSDSSNAGFNSNTLSCENQMNQPNTGDNTFGEQGPN
jgi:hypothetical protein